MLSIQITIGQTEFSNNNNYDHFLLNPGSIAPSAYSNTEPTLNILFRARTGLLKDISNIYTDFIFGSDNKSFGGIKLFSQRETRLFAHSKVLLVYGIRVPLNQKIKFISSAQLGLSNVFFGASRASGGSTSWLLDGGMSLSVVGESWNVSAMINQIPNQSHDFINAQLLLSRYYECLVTKQWNITRDWKVMAGTHALVAPQGNIIYLDSKVDYKEYGGISFGVQDFKSFSGGFKVNIPYQENTLSLIFSHRFGASANPLNSSANTVGIVYGFEK